MPDSEIRRATTASRRDGRRSYSAYESHARGVLLVNGERFGRNAQSRGQGRRGAGTGAGASSAGIALALVYPLVRRVQRSTGMQAVGSGGKGADMKQRKPSIKSLETVTLEEAQAYIAFAGGDELDAACTLAWDRNRLDGSLAAPDDAEVHHALFLLCRVLGKHAPSFDEMRVELRRRVAA